MKNEAILSSDRMFTSFRFNSHNIRFRTSPRLERYTKVVVVKLFCNTTT